MNYPYTEIEGWLKFQTDTATYIKITNQYVDREFGWLHGRRGQDYWAIIPYYVATRCPICLQPHIEQIDTYSLLDWAGISNGFRTGFSLSTHTSAIKQTCAHLVSFHRFLNLHEMLPTEMLYMDNKAGGVPFITPWMMPENLETYAVLHVLPICRIEGDAFVPRYTLFILAYFSPEPEAVIKQHYTKEWERGKDDHEFHPRSLGVPFIATSTAGQHLYDLQAWAQAGRLGYLDFTDPALPLRIGANVQLPVLYQQIPGRQGAYRWRDQRMTYYDYTGHPVPEP